MLLLNWLIFTYLLLCFILMYGFSYFLRFFKILFSSTLLNYYINSLKIFFNNSISLSFSHCSLISPFHGILFMFNKCIIISLWRYWWSCIILPSHYREVQVENHFLSEILRHYPPFYSFSDYWWEVWYHADFHCFVYCLDFSSLPDSFLYLQCSEIS